MESDRKRSIQLIILAYLIMTVFGFLMNLRGPIIPAIKGEFSVSYSSIGLMFLLTDIAYMLATFFGGIAGEKFGIKKILVFSFVIIILSVMSMNLVNSFTLFVLILFFITIGVGCFEIGLNALGARVFTVNAAVMMNLLHLFYGVGSIIGPKYSGWLLSINISWRGVYLYSLIVLFAVLLFLLATPFSEKKEERQAVKIPFKKLASDKRIWLLAGVLGFCIVAELGIANWMINFLQVEHKMNENDSSLYLSFFFVAFTIGRLVGGFLAERIGYVNILLCCTALYILLFSGGLILGGGWFILFSLTGFSVSVMYPTVMTIAMKEFRQDTTVAMGFIVTASGLFNMLASWLMGKTSDVFGVFVGFASVLLYVGLLIILLFVCKKLLTFERVDNEKAA